MIVEHVQRWTERRASRLPAGETMYCRGDLVGVALFGPPASMAAHQVVFPKLTVREAVTSAGAMAIAARSRAQLERQRSNRAIARRHPPF